VKSLKTSENEMEFWGEGGGGLLRNAKLYETGWK